MNIAYSSEVPERFIPISYDELTQNLVDNSLSLQEGALVANFSKQLRALYHARFHGPLQELKSLYGPFNPDVDTVSLISYEHQEYMKLKEQLMVKLEPLLDHANYEELSENALNEAMSSVSPDGVEVSVNFDDFEEVRLFYRGSAIREEKHRSFKTLFLTKESIKTEIYRRLFLLIKPKTLLKRASEVAREKGITQESALERLKSINIGLADDYRGEIIYLKLFKDIPKSDLEMLFPNTKVRMRLFDKLKLTVTGGGGTVAGAMTFMGKIAATVDPMALVSALGGFGAIVWRQISSVFNQRTKYMARLAKNLYFYNLDNNAGVLTNLIDKAEAEESKEALLAYVFLVEQKNGANIDFLDKRIEAFIANRFGLPMDFEVEDGVNKLIELGLISEDGDLLKAISLKRALRHLSSKWKKMGEEYGL